METVSFNRSLSFEIWVEIQVRGGVVLMLLNDTGDDIERNIDCNQKGFFWMRHGWFVGSSSANKLLLEDFQLKNHSFGVIGYGCNDIRRRVGDVRYNGFKFSSWVNCSVGSVRDFSVDGDSNKDGHWVFSQRVRDDGTYLQGRREFSQSCLNHVRSREKGQHRAYTWYYSWRSWHIDGDKWRNVGESLIT